MTALKGTLEEALNSAGYRTRAENVFENAVFRRTIGIIETPPAPSLWPERLDAVLRREPMRLAPSWSRYAVLIVSSARNIELSSAAAAFSRDVSKCRRIVAFSDQTPEQVLPFLSLPSVSGGAGTTVHDVDQIARAILVDEEITRAFLDIDVSVPTVQELAEQRD